MKKILFILVVAVIALMSCQTADQRMSKILVSENDSLIMVTYLKFPNAPEKLQLIADSIALETIDEARRLHAIGKAEESVIYNYIDLAIAILEKDYGVKKTADYLTEAMAYNYSCRKFNWNYFNVWNKDVSLIESLVSNSVLSEIKNNLSAEGEDLILKSRYTSNEQIAKDCMAGKFDESNIIHYAHVDSLNRKKILATVSDEALIHAQCIDIMSDEKRLKIARQPGFSYAEAFLLKNDEEKEDLLLESLDKVCAATILQGADKYRIYVGDRSEKIIKHLKKLSALALTESLKGKFVEDEKYYHFEKEEWTFQFDYISYSLIIISSVESCEDFRLATNFFLKNTHHGDEEKMLNILIQSKSSIL